MTDQNLIYFFENKNNIKFVKEKFEKENKTNPELLDLLLKEHDYFYEQNHEHHYVKT